MCGGSHDSSASRNFPSTLRDGFYPWQFPERRRQCLESPSTLHHTRNQCLGLTLAVQACSIQAVLNKKAPCWLSPMSCTLARVSIRAGELLMDITNEPSSNKSLTCPYSALRLSESGSADAVLNRFTYSGLVKP